MTRKHHTIVSAAMAASHPDAEDDFYEKFWRCRTVGDLHDLVWTTMHVEGRDRAIDWRRLERQRHRLQRQAEDTSLGH